MFDIKLEKNGEAHLSGRFDAAQVEKAEKVFDELDGPTIVSFEKLEYISSAGLSVLISAYKKLQSRGHSFRLTNMSKHVRDIFHYSRLDKIFEIE
jgi:anti-sigma B factor antagonist